MMRKQFPSLRVRHVAGLAEAAWLASILLVPLYFNPFTRRCFDPDRATLHVVFGLTACLSVLVALAALRRRFQLFLAPEHEDVAARFALKNVDRAVWLFFLSVTVSAVFSLSPQISTFGAYERGTSVLTTLAGVALFLAMRCFLTKRAQLEYAFLAFPLATVPIAVYAMCQKAGWDVIRWSNYFLGRVGGSLGNPIFLGAVMALALIMTLRNIYLSSREVSSPDAAVSSKALQRFVCFTGAAFLQAGALLLSGSRGPMLALMAGVFVIAVLGLLCRGRKRAAVLVLFAPLAVVALLFVGKSALEYAKVPPSVSHIFHILDEEGGNSQVRLLIWRGVSSMSVSWRTLRDAENNPDRYARLRPLIGYGPETLSLSFDPYFPTELGRLESRSSVIDKCHNEGWEAVATRGWFGFAAYSLLYMTLFAFGLDQLGFTPSRRNKRNLLLAMAGGGFAGAALFMLLKSVVYAMLGWAVGLVAGMLLYALRARRSAGGRSGEETCSLLTLLGALIALFVETQFGFLTVATNAWFWIVAGLLVSLSSCFRSHAFFCGHEARPFREFFPEGLTLGLMASLLVTSALFSVSSIPYEPTSLGRQFWRTLTGPAGVIVAVLCLWAFFLVFVMRAHRKPANGPVEAPLLSYWVAVLTSLLVFGAWTAFRQAGCTEIALEPEAERFVRSGAIGNVVIVPAAAFVCLIALLAFRRSRRGPGEAAAGDVRISPVYFASLGLLVLALAWCFGLQKIQADRYSQEALYAAGRKSWDLAVTAGREALHLNPNEAAYATDLGRYYYRKASETAEPAEAERLSIDAERFLNLAFSQSPWRAAPAQLLADYHLWRAGEAVSPAVSQLHAERAEYFYLVAIRLAPNNPLILNNLAKLYLRIWKLPDRALDVLQKSLRLDREYCVTMALVGECWYEIGEERSFGASRKGLFLQALSQFEAAFRTNVKQEVENPMEIRLKMARMYLELGDEAKYRDQAKLAIAAALPEEKDVVREELNLLRRRLGPYDQAGRAYHPRHSGKPKGASPAQDSLRKTAAPAL